MKAYTPRTKNLYSERIEKVFSLADLVKAGRVPAEGYTPIWLKPCRWNLRDYPYIPISQTREGTPEEIAKLAEQIREEKLKRRREHYHRKTGDNFPELPENIIFFDTETTGLYPQEDEILSLAIINREGLVLFNELFHPVRTKEWPEAEEVTGISPDMVRDAPPISEKKEDLQRIFDNARLAVGYNIRFDLRFIKAAGIEYNGEICDVMEDFAPIYQQWNEYRKKWQWQKLETCAAYFKYNWGDDQQHNALADTKATRYCFEKIYKRGMCHITK